MGWKSRNLNHFQNLKARIRSTECFEWFRLRVSVSFKRSFSVLVILPVTIMGVAIMCAAMLLMCLSSLTVLSNALKVSDHHYAESRLLSAQLLLRGDLRYDTTASLASVPSVLQRGIHFIEFDAPTLAPMAFTQFCLKYVNECKPQRLVFRGGRLKLSNQRWAELENVNRTVNSSILPQRNKEGLAGEKWLLGPVLGDCNDYAVTKRHQLTARGWPARAVLLSEVVTVSGEHHIVAVVRTSGGDLVLDNLTDRIMPWFYKPYQWVRMQTPKNPNYWTSISKQNA
jgi:predicted transglutaminase-like cysteine proteinase